MKRTLAIAAAALLVAVAATCLAPRGSDAAGKPATLRLLQEGLALELTLDNRTKVTVTTKPTPIAPGQYTVKSARLMKQDDKKRTWELRVDGTFSTLETLAVEAEQDKVIDVGEPILLDCFVWDTGKRSGNTKDVLLRVTAYGKYSEIYFPGAYLAGKKPPAPAWKFLSADGKVLGQGQFGSSTGDGRVQATVKVPKDYKGLTKVELTPIMGPFEWKYRNQENKLP